MPSYSNRYSVTSGGKARFQSCRAARSLHNCQPEVAALPTLASDCSARCGPLPETTGSRGTTLASRKKSPVVDNSFTPEDAVHLSEKPCESHRVRDAAINLRPTPAQRDLIERAAALLSKRRSEFIVEAACERAREVVMDQVFFSLDADKFHQFTALLDSPAAPNVGLQRLLAVQALWSVSAERTCARPLPRP